MTDFILLSKDYISISSFIKHYLNFQNCFLFIFFLFRYSARPKELVVECGPHTPGELDSLIEEQVEEAKTFLFDHRYDPSELYQDEFQEELQGIPDPKLDPYRILDDFLSILHTLGKFTFIFLFFILRFNSIIIIIYFFRTLVCRSSCFSPFNSIRKTQS